jgi:hypothetical protein
MELSGKKFIYYWNIIKYPLYVISGWYILGLIFAVISFETYLQVFSNISGIILSVLVAAFAGWSTIKDFKGEVRYAAWSGALLGVISGLVSSIIALIMFFGIPQMMTQAIQAATAQGAPSDVAAQFIKLGIFIGLLLGPIVSGLFGALISVISGFIAKKIK